MTIETPSPETTSSPEAPGDEPQAPQAPEAIPPEPNAPATPAADPAQGTPEAPKDEPPQEPESAPEQDAPAAEFFYGDQQVEVEVPDDVRASLSDNGIDVDKVVAELYAKDGDFSLSDETRQALYEKYPQPIVDSYLKMLKTQNDRALKDTQAQAEAAERDAQASAQWGYEQVGGQENWDAMQAWLEQDTEAVSDDQIAGFNAAMQSGDRYLQQLALRDLQVKYREAQGDGGEVPLIEGEGGGGDVAGPLSAADYAQEMLAIARMPRVEKAEAQRKLDARRRAGMKKGL